MSDQGSVRCSDCLQMVDASKPCPNHFGIPPMTTQEPVPNLDELLRRFGDLDTLVEQYRVLPLERREFGVLGKLEEERAIRRTALITAIEAPWREALRLFQKFRATGVGPESQEAWFENYFDARVSALLNQDTEVNDD